MTYNLQGYKIQTFTDINDKPIEPTANKAGNGAHLIQQFNYLIDSTELVLNGLQQYCDDLASAITSNTTPAPAPIPKWITVNNEYTTKHGDRILYTINPTLYPATSINLKLYASPQIGDVVEIMKVTTDYQVNLDNYLGRFNFNSYYSSVYIPKTTKDIVGLIYCGDDNGGWVPTKQGVFATTQSSS
ncbi:hypothetical protein [Aliterella atlantica]|uniref:Uncharacterized protein n=1 Tax=Aliterella atlantica CENA595 TaxID=1618023 RepID=A0A0D8ZKM7_9CYAN|nr:hypothetical protein [Aliterella atlantica]KJH69393.1 hypothetical protein UH38_24120 [Aliterella atlantica CENA595]